MILSNLLEMVKQGEVRPEALPFPPWILRLSADEYETLCKFNSEEGFNPQTKLVTAEFDPFEDLEELEELEEEEVEENDYYDDEDPSECCTCPIDTGFGSSYTDHHCPVHGEWDYPY